MPGHSTAAESNALYRKNLAKGQTGLSVAFDLPTQTGYDTDHVLARGEVGKVGVPICASRRHARAVRRHSARRDEHLDDHQRHRGVADGALHRGRRRAGRAARGADRHDPERHHQGISVARHLRVSAGAVDAADQGHRDLHDARAAEMESDERLLVPSAGSGRDAGAGAGLRAGHRDRGARHGEGVRRGRRRRNSARWSGASRSSSMPGMRFITEICKMRAFVELWDEITRERYGVTDPEAAAVPLRRAGQFARPHRAAAGEQRLRAS